mmetsp:Transcript_32701/g.43597  ORF Transcript_32701/g.43597 Transcript_32701/m.43597 type:complete len:87 (-) Transcript_32701:66-326(-)
MTQDGTTGRMSRMFQYWNKYCDKHAKNSLVVAAALGDVYMRICMVIFTATYVMYSMFVDLGRENQYKGTKNGNFKKRKKGKITIRL